jgi:Flp pilus assembly pilin Flp
MKFKKYIGRFYQKIKEFFADEYGGNLVEYALLIGFAIFIFFLIVGLITNLFGWVTNSVNGFFDDINVFD